MLTVPFKLLNSQAVSPSCAYHGDSGLDLYPLESFSLKPGERKLISTGVAVEIPFGYEGEIRPRSGLAVDFGVTVLNSPGTIDANFRGELKVILINHGQEVYQNYREAIAQLVIKAVCLVRLEKTEELSVSSRGDQGFGSSTKTLPRS